MNQLNRPCSVTWCVALALEGKDVCACHVNRRDLHPQQLPRDKSVPRHWPRTPWDDERPWDEVYR